MKRVPKPLEALVAVAKRQDASLDDIMSAAKATDQRVLKENAHFVLTSIPGTNDTGLGAIKFIAIHRAIGSEPVIFAMIAATLTRGPMVDREACIALEYMLKEACMPLVSGPFSTLSRLERARALSCSMLTISTNLLVGGVLLGAT